MLTVWQHRLGHHIHLSSFHSHLSAIHSERYFSINFRALERGVIARR